MAVRRTVNCVFVADRSFTSIRIGTEEGMTVALLEDAIKENEMYAFPADQLKLFLAKDEGGWLSSDILDATSLEDGAGIKRLSNLMSKAIDPAAEIGDVFGGAPTIMTIHVLVKLPEKSTARQGAEAALTQQAGLLTTRNVGHHRPFSSIPLEHREELAKESLLTEWGPGSMQHVPLMYNFMKDLGGCSTNGKLWWRREDQQLVTLLVKLWFQENISDTLNAFKGRQSIVVGAQGVGKSTVLLVLAFYLVLTRKKNVLVYRRLPRKKCLFYLGYDDAENEVQYFTLAHCEDKEANRIYEQLCKKLESDNVWLLLDGFEYDEIPDGMRSFELLSTSLQVDLKSQDTEAAFTCLLSSWKKADIFKLGQEVYGFDAVEIVKRYHFSGGDLWQFRCATLCEIELNVQNALWHVQDASKLLSSNWSGSDRLQQTFIRTDNLAERENEEEWAGFLGLLGCNYWDQVVDSEYAVLELTKRLHAASGS